MKDMDYQVAYWDKVASRKTFSHPVDWEMFASLVFKYAHILDVGCGYGRIAAELGSKGYMNVVGIDSSPGMIERARQLAPQPQFQVVPGIQLPFKKASFDVVILFAVLTCVPSDLGQKNLIEQIHTVLRPRGLVYVSDYPLQNDDRNVSRYKEYKEEFGNYGVFRLSDGGVVRHHDMDWIRSLLSEFEEVETTEIDIVTMNGNVAKAFQYFGHKS